MAIAGILTQSQASEENLAASVKQWIYQNVILPYNTAIPNDGMQLQGDGSWKSIKSGIQVIMGGPTDDSLYEFVPIVGYVIDDKENSKDPEPTGMGDGANWEYRSVGMCCLPGLTVGSDGTFMANRKSQFILRGLMANAFLRAKILPIVDSTATPSGNLFPQLGYAEIKQAYFVTMSKDITALLDAHKLRFDCHIEIRWAVAGTN